MFVNFIISLRFSLNARPIKLWKMGFRKFVGVDGSEGMLKLARKTELYQELKQCMLGEDRLPVQDGNKHIFHLLGHF